MRKEKMIVSSQNEIAENIFELVLEGELVHGMNNPGQFVHIKVDASTDPLLRRPISICDIDKEKNQFTMIYRKDGKGTSLLSEKKKGDVVDVLGPLGNGFSVDEIKNGEKVLLIGGGIGVPPMYYLSKQIKSRGGEVTHVLGFQTKDVVFYEEKFSQLGKTFVATVDGTHGNKGFVTDVINDEGIDFDCFYACGPLVMLKALEEQFSHKKGYISLEERMGCGIGACFACVCHPKNDKSGTSYRKICSDGPVFPIGEVVL